MKYNKLFTENLKTEKAPEADILYIPACQHIGAAAKIIVKKDDEVKVGQLLAEANGYCSANIHSSVSGKVLDVKPHIHTNGSKVMTVVIENNKKYQAIKTEPIKNFKSLTKETLINKIKEFGIAGLGGATFPTHVKLETTKPIQELIINGAECEPYLTADHRLMLEDTKMFYVGLEIVQHILNPEKIYIGVEDNKLDCVKSLKTYGIHFNNLEIRPLPTKYPQGAEKILVKNITGKNVHKLPIDVGSVVLNVGTITQIGKSFTTGMPLIDRIVTLSGELLEKKHNYRVRIGTPFKTLLPDLSYLGNQEYKIIAGGPMMGTAQYDINVPVLKGTSGILVIPNNSKPEGDCIRCGTCIDNCPVGLLPIVAAKKGLQAIDCMECGLCSYNCPANVNLVQRIRLQKNKIKKIACECKK
ncbi:MAG: electron transport complex subunit RsxC [Candidatus Margulisbacteria bacterium]|nr:electron transport complex subunit RsxC [Candidatus Margulisiibacteriota bacterium]